MYILLCVLSVSAEEGAECSEREGSHEVVTGTREDTPFSDTRNDETRGKVGSTWVTTTVSVISHYRKQMDLLRERRRRKRRR